MPGRTHVPGDPPVRALMAPALLAPALFALALAAAVLAWPGAGGAARPAGDIPDPTRGLLEEKAGDLILRAQKVLGQIGLYVGPEDGRMTPQTEAAVRAFQRRSGVRVDGRVTPALVEGLENSIQVRVLLRRLDKVRIQNMAAARKALLSHPATRDLVAGGRDKVADPTRDLAACLKRITVRCLIDEAVESAKAVYKPELRDWALGEILAAQARAGLRDAAMETVSLMRDPRLIMVALRDIAEAQAAAGLSEEALSAVAIIPDADKKAEALAAIAAIQARRGDLGDARATTEALLQSLDAITAPLSRLSFKAKAAVILAQSGDGESAAAILAEAESFARTRLKDGARSVALRHVAGALAETRQVAQALSVLTDVTDDSNRTPVLIATATEQARAGDAAAALSTADTIEAVRYRAVVLGHIALVQAEKNDIAGAEATLALARAAIEKITLPFARSYAISRVSLAMAGIGRLPAARPKSRAIFEGAVRAADGIDDNRLRAHTLWAIAAEQTRAGDGDGAGQTKALARKATGLIKSTLSQVWMFSEIAVGHAAAGEKEAAWAAFDNGVDVARTIDNPWGRARTFGKLAATLIELVDPGKGLGPGGADTW